MYKLGLVSTYTIKQYKNHRTSCNEENTENIINREFYRNKKLDVVVSDLTYVNLNDKQNYKCLILYLYNREIVGYSVGPNKTSQLVYEAFSTIKSNLNDVNIFHTDRGNEFKNKLIDDLLISFNIKRSLSKKGCPYDNSVAEATYKIIKTEFAFKKIFKDLESLKLQLFDYVNWFNNERIHSSLGYKTQVQYKLSN